MTLLTCVEVAFCNETAKKKKQILIMKYEFAHDKSFAFVK